LAQRATGIVEHHVAAGADSCGQRVHLVLIGDVADDSYTIDLIGEFSEPVETPRRAEHLEPVGREGAGAGGTDATGCASDHGDFSITL